MKILSYYITSQEDPVLIPCP